MAKKTPEQKRVDTEERRFQAESDARTLSNANEIRTDKPRMNRAVSAADRLAKQAEKEAKNIRQVARTPRKAKKKRG